MHHVVNTGQWDPGSLSKLLCSTGRLSFTRSLCLRTGTEGFVPVKEQGKTKVKLKMGDGARPKASLSYEEGEVHD